MKTRDISETPVNQRRCHSCPFNDDGCRDIRAKVEARCLTEASQLCHGTHNRTLCRGARDFQIQAFHRIGFLKRPTDECWDETNKRLKRKQ